MSGSGIRPEPAGNDENNPQNVQSVARKLNDILLNYKNKRSNLDLDNFEMFSKPARSGQKVSRIVDRSDHAPHTKPQLDLNIAS